jgi:LPXTG-motif cell wall-anchored protein
VKFSRRAVVAVLGSLLLALLGTTIALSNAGAATLPPWESPAEANEIGTLTFYNAAGDVVTSGSTSSGPVAAYVVGSHAGRAGDALATLQAFTPTPGVNPALWGGESLSASTDYPVTDPAAPAVVRSTSLPVVTGQAAEFPLDGYVGDFPQTSSTAGYVNTYQLRLQTSGPGQSAGAEYDAADIVISGHTWTQVFPVTKVATTVAAVSPSVASPAAHGSSVTLTSTLSAGDASHPAGAVELFDGLADVGPATLTAGTGAISKTITPADGSHSYTLVFTPTDTGAYNGATSPALSYTVNAAVLATTTSTTLGASPVSPSVLGTNVTLTATVSPNTAAGTVQFFDGSAAINSAVAVSAGSASTSTAGLSLGSHSITAHFIPTDPTAFTTSTSAVTTYQVNPVPATPTTTGLVVSPASPVTFGATVTLTSTVSPSNAPGTVQFLDGSAPLGSAVAVAAGTAVKTISTLSASSHSITAQFVPTTPANFGSSTSSAHVLVVNPPPATSTITTLVASPTSPVNQGTSVNLKATLSPTTAVGKVQFLDGGAAIGTPVTVTSGIAQVNTTALTVASHALTAQFTPTDSSVFTASTSTAVTFVVNTPPPGATTTALTVTPASPVTVRDTVTLKATVSPSTVTGSVQFLDASTTIGAPVTIVGGIAQITTSSLSAGSHSLTAQFSSGSVAFTDSTSSAHTLVVNPPAVVTSTTLAVSPAGPVDFGTAVQLDATVSPSSAPGSVQFFDSAKSLGTSAVVAGAATFNTTTLAGGAHSLTAKFLPTHATDFTTSTSAAQSITVNPPPAAATTTTLAVSPTTLATVGDRTMLTASVTPSSAVGSVTFADGATTLGTASVSAGKATFTTTSLAEGDHTFTAHYVPTDVAAFLPSTSSAASLAVKKAPVISGCSVNGAPVTAGSDLAPGSSVTLAATGFQPNETVTVVVRSTPQTLGHVTANAGGAITATVTLPSTLQPGSHTLTLSGSLASVRFAFTVAAAPTVGSGSDATSGAAPTSVNASAALPNTGAQVGPLSLLGLALLVGGVAALMLARRYGTARHGKPEHG